MRKPKVEKFSIQTIKNALCASDLESARASLAFAVGARLEVSGTILKFVKREALCRLVITPGADSDLVIFANFKRVQRKLRKGSAVLVRGKFQSFGLSAVCLGDCRLKDGGS